MVSKQKRYACWKNTVPLYTFLGFKWEVLLLSWLWRKNSYWTCAAFLSNTYLPNVFLSRLERSENQTKYFGIFRRLKKEINIGIKRVKQMSHISKKIIEFQSICYWRQKSLFHSCCCFGRFLQHLQNDTCIGKSVLHLVSHVSS